MSGNPADRGRNACWPVMAPATPAYFSSRQGQKCLLACDGSCPGCFILNAAGWKKLARQEWLLPRKLYSQCGRVEEACQAGVAPAPEALFSMRQGGKSLPGRSGSCPGSFILNAAGWKKLARQERLLPRMLYSHSGRVEEACQTGAAPAPDALFSFRQGGRSLPGGATPATPAYFSFRQGPEFLLACDDFC